MVATTRSRRTGEATSLPTTVLPVPTRQLFAMPMRYRKVDGFPVALTRHVTARLGGLAVPVTAVHAELAVVGAA